jgi:sirohydrochlorin cobaltochelatase
METLNLTEKLERWVAGGGRLIGEVAIELGVEGYRLTHVEDRGRSDLDSYRSPIDARALVRYDAAGEYRPLKSAPGLRRGWELILVGVEGLREALDYFYPAAVGTWFANEETELIAPPLRAVLGRQTGMYRFANNVSDERAQALVGSACASRGGCLKRVCWDLADGQPLTGLPAGELGRAPLTDGEMPLLCVEACNWLVAKARKVSASERTQEEIK